MFRVRNSSTKLLKLGSKTSINNNMKIIEDYTLTANITANKLVNEFKKVI